MAGSRSWCSGTSRSAFTRPPHCFSGEVSNCRLCSCQHRAPIQLHEIIIGDAVHLETRHANEAQIVDRLGAWLDWLGLREAELATLVTRNAMIGVEKAKAPDRGSRGR